ncbi:MAG: phosphopantetheine adenylyltransferase [Pseudomonadota bacterium]
MQILIAISLFIAGLIHVTPAIGVLGKEQLARLYGLPISDPNLLVLMRHRAVLFLVVGLLLWLAIIRAEYRLIAVAFGLLSTISFLFIVYTTPEYNAQLARIAQVDIVAVILLLFVGATLVTGSAR